MAYKQIEVLQQYGDKSLLKWQHPQHVDFVIASGYDPLKQEWAQGQYFSAMNNNLEEMKNAAETQFFISCLKQLGDGEVDFSQFDAPDLAPAYSQYWINARIDYISQALEDFEPELSKNVDDVEIAKLAQAMTYTINEYNWVNDAISQAEIDYMQDVVIPRLKDKYAKNIDSKQVIKDTIQPTKSTTKSTPNKDAR